MKIQVFIFNYDHFENATRLFHGFSSLGLDTYWVNCESPNDPELPDSDRVIKLPNVYYSGQWNEALRLATGDVILITNADVGVKSPGRLVSRMRAFYEKYGDRAGLYAPNVNWTPWTYNPALLEDIGDDLKKVVATDSTIWSLRTPIARRVGPLDLSVNKLGWGIEVVAAYYCMTEGRLVVRDYGIRCDHPQSTAYNRGAADLEWRNWVATLGIGSGFWKYMEGRNRYGFGWSGDDRPTGDRFPKMFA